MLSLEDELNYIFERRIRFGDWIAQNAAYKTLSKTDKYTTDRFYYAMLDYEDALRLLLDSETR